MDINNNKDLENAHRIHQDNMQNVSPALTREYPSRQNFDLGKGDVAFTVCAVIGSIFSSIFGIFGGYALGYLLSIVLMVTVFVVYFAKNSKVNALAIICGLLSLANGAVFICTTNGSIRFFGAIISFLLSLVCYDGLVNGASKGNRQTLGVFYSATATIGNMGVALKSIFSRDKGGLGKVLIGLICAIPVLIVVLPLLMFSDHAFYGLMTNIFSNTFTTILKTIFGLILSLFVISYGFSLKKGRVAKIKQGNFSGIENVYIISFLSALGVCYLLYLFSQLAYFFSAFKGFLPDKEITYAEYARKGFFEMCIIAVINLGIVFLAFILAKKTNGKVCHGIKGLATFVSVFTLIIISTAISKMVLYIDTYGMTVLRLTTSAFMVFLAIAFISVILRIYIRKINVVKTALISAGCILLVLGVFNVNAVCGKYNYESYKAGKLESVDVGSLYNLGYEGIPYIVKLAEGNDEFSEEAQKCLAKAYLIDYFDDMENADAFTLEELKENEKNTDFKRFSIPKARAYDELYEYIENHPEFSSKCQDLLSQRAYRW